MDDVKRVGLAEDDPRRIAKHMRDVQPGYEWEIVRETETSCEMVRTNPRTGHQVTILVER